MKKITELFQNPILANGCFSQNRLFLIFLPLIAAVLLILPAIPFLKNNHCFLMSSQAGTYPDGDDYPYYTPKTAAFAKGYFGIGDSAIYEYRDSYSNTSEKIPPIITGIIHLVTQDMSWTHTITVLLFIPVSYFAGYIFFSALIKNKRYIHFMLIILIFIPELYFLLPLPGSMYLLPLGRYIRRFYNILVTFPLLMIYLRIVLKYFLSEKKDLKVIFALGGIIGIFAYSYLYYWIYSIALLGIITMYLLISQKKNRISLLFTSLAALGIGIFISSLFLFNIWNEVIIAKTQSGFGAIFQVERLWQIRSHWYFGNVLSLRRISVFFFLLFILEIVLRKIYKKSILKDKKFIFLILALLASEVCYNSNVITGLSIEPDHFYYVLGSSLCFFLGGYIVYKLIKYGKLEDIIHPILILLVLLGVSYVKINQFKVMELKANQCSESIFSVISFLRNIPKDSVILSGDTSLNSLVLNYTHNFNFLTKSNFTSIQYHELIERQAVVLKLLNYDISFLNSDEVIDSKNSPTFLSTLSLFDYSFRYNIYHNPQPIFISMKGKQFNSTKFTSALPLEVKKELLTGYENASAIRKKYKLDYLVVNSNVNLDLRNHSDTYNLVFSNKDFSIYKIGDNL